MKNKKILLFLCLLFIPISGVYANVIWPALLAEEKISSLPIILLSCVIEFFFFKRLFKLKIKKAVLFTLIANGVSATAGVFLRPLSGVVWEFIFGIIAYKIFNIGTFNPVTWFSVPMLGGAVNALVELLTIKIIWKHKITKKNYLLTWLINIFTVAIAVIWYFYKLT